MMKSLTVHPYRVVLTNGVERSGAWVQLTDESGVSGWGEIAPLPNWSRESLKDSLDQINRKQNEILEVEWTLPACLEQLSKLRLLPSVEFGLESALLSLLAPLKNCFLPACALLMGSVSSILEQARIRQAQGYRFAKLKVGQLSFEKARSVIEQLKEPFRLRVDVNRAWNTSDSLRFFESFPLETFDYIEEPFQDPQDLHLFSHPLAVDESFPEELSFEQLESVPALKALIYKPSMQGGLSSCLRLREWTAKKGIALVLSSSFETDLGLAHIAAMAFQLGLSSPIGLGTYHYLTQFFCSEALQFSDGKVYVSKNPVPLQPPTYSSPL